MDIKVNANTVIVFDLDDTLYNELDFLKSAYQAIAQYLDVNNWKPLYVSMFSLYRNGKNVFEFLSSTYTVDKHLLIDKYRSHTPSINLFDNALEKLNFIKANNGKIGIITDGRYKTQIAKIKALGIYDFLDKIVISEEIGTEKPDANNFKAIEDAFPDHQYWYIADNLKKDFIAPKKMGWQTVGLIDNGKNIHFGSHKYLNELHEPQAFILSISELNII